MTDENWQAELIRTLAPSDSAGRPATLVEEPPEPAPERPVFHGGTATDAVQGTEVLARHADVHGDPPARRCLRALRTILGRDATREVEELAALAERAGQPITTGRRITVAGVRGGAGKSTVSALLTTTLAGLRRDHVLAVDADADAGSLPLRLGPLGRGVTVPGAGDLAPASAFQRVARYLDRTAGGVWLWRRALSAALARQDEAQAALLLRDRVRFLGRHFAVTVADLGAGLHGAANRALIADSHAVLLTGTATLDGVLGVDAALRRLGQDHGFATLTRAVLVLATTVPGPLGVDLRRAADGLRSFGVPVLVLPFDRHLALGAAIDQSRLGAGTRAAALRVAAATMDRATLP